MNINLRDKTVLQVLILEDSQRQREGFSRDFAKLGWKYTFAYNKEDALIKINDNQRKKWFDVLVLDCVINNIKDEGVRLAIELADRRAEQRILVYTVQEPGSSRIDYNLFTKELISRRISFIKLNDNEEIIPFEIAIWATWKGFLVFSPTPANYLPKAIARYPDPLEDTDWKILQALHQFPDNRRRAANKIGMTVTNLNTRLRDKIRQKLNPLIFTQTYYLTTSPDPNDSVEENGDRSEDFEDAQYEQGREKITDEIIRVYVSWYLQNRVKYSRD